MAPKWHKAIVTAASAVTILFWATFCPPERSDAAGPQKSDFDTQLAPVLRTYCFKCHIGSTPKGDVNLAFTSAQDFKNRVGKDRATFQTMSEVLASHEMPPAKQPQPTEIERQQVIHWLNDDLLAVDPSAPRNPGHVAALRRLTNIEYQNTVRDLLDLPNFKIADDFPADSFANGFDNMAELLGYSTSHMEHYLDAAEEAIRELDATCVPSQNWDSHYMEPAGKVFEPIREYKLSYDNNQDRVRALLVKFLPRAYRRPVTSEEIERLMAFARTSLAQEGESFIRPKSCYAPIRAALLSPYFLFRVERDPASGVAPVDEYELASRLSYFLWSSMPDDELFDLASRKQLRAHLDEQVLRLLADPKAGALTDNFAEQWLKLRALNKVTPDPKLFPAFSELLRQSMMQEIKLFFASMVRHDSRITDLLDGKYTFVNEELAKYYGIPGVNGTEFRRVELDAATHRRGLLTTAGILTLTSAPNRTSPVRRGVWILDTIFNHPPKPPPPNVPALESSGNVLVGTVRQVLAQHRNNPQCAGCHANIDPMGLALENFDAAGKWRDAEAGAPVDASGVLPTGEKFRSLEEFQSMLETRQSDFRRSLVQHLSTYALGRGLEYFDKPMIDDICAAVAARDDRFSSVIIAIVNSDAFQKRQAREENDHAK
jgi:hypothetical protein